MIIYYKKEYPSGTIVIGKFDDECPIDDSDLDYLADVYHIDTDTEFLRIDACKDIINVDEFDSVEWVDETYYSHFGDLLFSCLLSVRHFLKNNK